MPGALLERLGASRYIFRSAVWGPTVDGTTHRMARKLGLANRLILATMRMVTVLGTIGLGIVTSSDVRAQTQPRGTQSAAAPLESTGDSSALLARAREKNCPHHAPTAEVHLS